MFGISQNANIDMILYSLYKILYNAMTSFS